MRASHAAASVACGIIGGVLARSFVPLGHEFVIATALLAGALFCVGAWARTHKTAIAVLALGILAVGGGVLRADMAFVVPDALKSVVGSTVALTGVVVQHPEQRPQVLHVVIESALAPGEYVLVRADRAVRSAYGETVRVIGELERPEAFTGDDGVRVFDYPNYLAKDGIRYVMYYPHIETGEAVHSTFLPMGVLYGMKDAFVRAVQTMLLEPYAALANGITVGERQALTAYWKEVFIATGLIHIVVLSGFNITLIASTVVRMLRWCSVGRYTQFIVGVCIVLGFVLMTGASSTGVRAGCMAAIAMLATLLHRDFDGLRALAAAGVFMVLLNPYVLVFDPGFQLSIIATFGLIFATPVFERYFAFVPTTLDLRGVAAATASTYVFVLPHLLYLTGNLSVISLAVNMVVLPAIVFAMIAVFLGAGATMIFPAGAALFGAPALVLLWYTLTVAQWGAQVPHALLYVPAFPFWVVALSYAMLLVIFAQLRTALLQPAN